MPTKRKTTTSDTPVAEPQDIAPDSRSGSAPEKTRKEKAETMKPAADEFVGKAPAVSEPSEKSPAETPSDTSLKPQADLFESAGPAVSADRSQPRERQDTEPTDDRSSYNRGQGRGAYHQGDQRGYSESGNGRDNGRGYYSQRGGHDGSNRRYERDRFEQGLSNTPTETVKGYLDVQPEGHGFLRPKFIPSQRDIYISQSQIRRFMLRAGDLVGGIARPPKDTERYYGLLKVETVNGSPAEESANRPWFDDLTPIYPKLQLKLASGKKPVSTRIIDLVAPIGFGQRGMIVSPPKAGKTTIMKEIASGVTANFPDVHLMAALIGERPEEVTDISMSVRGEVVASNFDEPPDHQTRVAEIALDRAKRMVELGKDVVVLLDSITRLARAYNLSVESSGRTLSGGFDPAALWPAKRFFGAARNCQEGGSLTIIGTALVETGSRMDDLIYEEFKGTGNMELHLERKLAERRIYPAINIERSSTRQEQLLLSDDEYKKVVIMRRMMDLLNPDERTELFIEKLLETESNEEFLNNLGKA